MVECPRFCGSDVLLRIQVQHTILRNNLHFDLAVNDIHELMNIIDSMHFMCTPPKTFASWEMNTVCVCGGGGGGHTQENSDVLYIMGENGHFWETFIGYKGIYNKTWQKFPENSNNAIMISLQYCY